MTRNPEDEHWVRLVPAEDLSPDSPDEGDVLFGSGFVSDKIDGQLAVTENVNRALVIDSRGLLPPVDKLDGHTDGPQLPNVIGAVTFHEQAGVGRKRPPMADLPETVFVVLVSTRGWRGRQQVSMGGEESNGSPATRPRVRIG